MDTFIRFEAIFTKHGLTDYKWIDPRSIVVAQWVRMKCMFGCSEYGRNASCPPNTPSVPECRRFFDEYKTAAIFHFQKTVDRPEDRGAWTRQVNMALLEVEREVFLSGYQKAFLLFMDSCRSLFGMRWRAHRVQEPRLRASRTGVYGGGCFCDGTAIRLSHRSSFRLFARNESVCIPAD